MNVESNLQARTKLFLLVFLAAASLLGSAAFFGGSDTIFFAARAENSNLNPNDRRAFEANPANRNISFSFSGYANPQRPFPGYRGQWQLGPVRISGRGVLRSNGTLASGGRIGHTDQLRDRNYPSHSTSWQITGGRLFTRSGATVLRLNFRVTSSNYRNICPVGTRGIIELVDDNRRLSNRQTRDGIRTWMPNPYSMAPDRGAACRTHVHGFNNMSYSWTNPRRGGPGGGMIANVSISGGGTTGGGHTGRPTIKTNKTYYAPNERIRVSYANLPGNSRDWITIVKSNSRAGSYGQWSYTNRRRSGSMTFRGLPAGRYQARVHFPGSSAVRAYYNFSVRSGGGGGGVSSGRFRHFTNTAIWYYNRRTLRNSTVSRCKTECARYSWCTSFEYHRASRFCNLHYGNGKMARLSGYDLYVKQ